eukprot:GEMP01040227.1.p1 GENE.GEMP01040227.1~~GEMP01040227.1.p1  ORF type:complete len:342 (+),score=66.28 GEMP01040227.1:3-1028(+)
MQLDSLPTHVLDAQLTSFAHTTTHGVNAFMSQMSAKLDQASAAITGVERMMSDLEQRILSCTQAMPPAHVTSHQFSVAAATRSRMGEEQCSPIDQSSTTFSSKSVGEQRFAVERASEDNTVPSRRSGNTISSTMQGNFCSATAPSSTVPAGYEEYVRMLRVGVQREAVRRKFSQDVANKPHLRQDVFDSLVPPVPYSEFQALTTASTSATPATSSAANCISRTDATTPVNDLVQCRELPSTAGSAGCGDVLAGSGDATLRAPSKKHGAALERKALTFLEELEQKQQNGLKPVEKRTTDKESSTFARSPAIPTSMSFVSAEMLRRRRAVVASDSDESDWKSS